MKAGRPSYHVPSKWVTVTTPQGMMYFDLDEKGNLVKGDTKELRPSHIVPLGPCPVVPPVIAARGRHPAKAQLPGPPHPGLIAAPPPPPAPPRPPSPVAPPEPQTFFDDDSLSFFNGFSEFPDDFSYQF
jgi:hypothetical protein